MNPINLINPFALKRWLAAKADASALAAEVMNRVNADAAEVTARTAAIGVEVTNRNTAIGVETTNRNAAVNALAAIVDALGITDIDQLAAVLLAKADLVNGFLKASQVPLALLGALRYQTGWNAATNTPNIAAAVSNPTDRGMYWIVNVAGATNLGGITDWQIGDHAVFNGSTGQWDKYDYSAILQTALTTTATDPTTGAASTVQAALNNIWAPFAVATAFGKSLLNLANAAAARQTLEVNPLAGYCGDGSDGAIVISVNTSLLADMYCSSLVVNAGVTLKTNAFRILCTGTITNNGTISGDGNNATVSTGGTAIGAGTLNRGGAGVNGATGVGTAAVVYQTLTSLGGNSGKGGNGASGVGGAAANGGVVAATRMNMRSLPMAAIGIFMGTPGFQFLSTGQGGGGGGGDGTNQGGGGGASGVPVLINAYRLINNGLISSKGGNGGTRAGGNVGGGGGAGGGVIILNTTSYSGTGSLSVDGGLGGAGNGTGTAGDPGLPGVIYNNVWN